MRVLDREKERYSDINIPLAVLKYVNLHLINYSLCAAHSYVDDSRNPELFTKHQLEKTLADHQAVQKKVEAYKVYNIMI